MWRRERPPLLLPFSSERPSGSRATGVVRSKRRVRWSTWWWRKVRRRVILMMRRMHMRLSSGGRGRRDRLVQGGLLIGQLLNMGRW